MQKILVSACLLGVPVRYDGQAKTQPHPRLQQWRREGRLITVCPEVAGGLATPRPPAEIEPGQDGAQVWAGQGRVLTATGEDVSAAFRRGAEQALQLVRVHAIRLAILKANSPSCGNRAIYDGTFQHRLHTGQGVTAAALQAAGVRVFNEREIEQAAQWLAQLDATEGV